MEAVTTLLRRLPLLLALLAFPSAVLAHRLDEYLQATLVVIEPDAIRLQVNLAPGTNVAAQILALIDRDNDGAVSTNEGVAYMELVRRELELQLDHRPLELRPAANDFPPLEDLRAGWGAIQMEFAAAPGPLALGLHELSLANRHQTNVSAYLVNAALPKSSAIRITRQTRNQNQSMGQIEFTFQRTITEGADVNRIIFPVGGALVILGASAVIWWRRMRESP